MTAEPREALEAHLIGSTYPGIAGRRFPDACA